MPKLSLHLVPVLPVWAVALLCVALLAVLAHGSTVLVKKQVPRRWVAILGGLRVAVVVLFALVLLQPVLSFTTSAERKPGMLVLLDTSASMGQPGGAANVTRLGEVVGALDGGGLAAELARHFELRWFALDRGAAPLEGTEWTTAEATGEGTNYADSLTQAWNYPRPDATAGGAAERVLLVSDGQDRGSSDLAEVAQRLGVAVDVLAPGSPPPTGEPAPVRVADVQGARRVLLGSETHFLVTLATDPAAADRTVTLTLAEGGKDLESTRVVLRAGRTEERVRLAHRPTEIGPKRYEFRVGGVAYPLSVQVVEGRHEVLVLEDTWRWEFKFLRRVLEEDPSFRFTALLSRGGGAFMQFAAPDRSARLVGFPQNHAQLAAFDTVVLGDVNPKRWAREFAASLRRLIAEEGKSLVVLAGPNLLHWGDAPDLLALLPVEVTRETANPVTGPVPVRPSAEGARSPFFLQPGSAAGPGTLPALDQVYPPLRKKPAATVLLEAARLGNAYGPLIVMAEHTAGRGRVLYVGTDTLWKWQTLTTAADANTTPYHLFWQQTLRALAPLHGGGGAVNLWLQPRRSRVEAGRPAAVRAEVEASGPLPQASVQGVVSLPDGRSLPVSFAADPAAPNAYVAEFETATPGQYRLTATVTSEGRTAAEGSTVLDVDEARPERDGAPVDRANLARIAAATGGAVLDPADSETWPAGAVTRERVVQRHTVDLWNRSYLLVLLVGVAGVDWLLRLLRGYV